MPKADIAKAGRLILKTAYCTEILLLLSPQRLCETIEFVELLPDLSVPSNFCQQMSVYSPFHKLPS